MVTRRLSKLNIPVDTSYLKPNIKTGENTTPLKRVPAKSNVPTTPISSLMNPGVTASRSQPSGASLLSTPSYEGVTNKPTSMTPVAPVAPKSWTQDKMIGNMNVGDFVSIAGMLGYAVAPDTPSGRIGQVAAGFAQREQDRLAKAPGEAIDRKDKLLDIAKKEKDLATQGTPKEWDAYYKAGKAQGLSDSEIVENFKSIGKTTKDPLTKLFPGGDMKQLNRDTGKWETIEKGTAKDTGKYHFQVDDSGKTSIYKDGKLMSGSGKGKSKATEAGEKDTTKKDRADRYKAVSDRMKEWKRTEAGVYAKGDDISAQRKKFQSQYDAAMNNWTIKYNKATGEMAYLTEDGELKDEFGVTLKDGLTPGDATGAPTFTFKMPKR